MKYIAYIILFLGNFLVHAVEFPRVTSALRKDQCDEKLEVDIAYTLKQLKQEGFSEEKLAQARLYMDLLKEKYRIQGELLIMDRASFGLNMVGPTLRAPFVTYGDCQDNAPMSGVPIELALNSKTKESPCKIRFKNELNSAFLRLKNVGISKEGMELAQYYVTLLKTLQEIDLKLMSMNRVTFPYPDILGKFRDPFVPFEQCKSLNITNPFIPVENHREILW